MTDFRKYEEIAGLIARGLLQELNPGESLKLKVWIEECPENSALYSHIKDSGNFLNRNKELEKIDIQSGWENQLYRINMNGSE